MIVNRSWVGWLDIDDYGIEWIGGGPALGVANNAMVQLERDEDEWSPLDVDGLVVEQMLDVTVFGVCRRSIDVRRNSFVAWKWDVFGKEWVKL